MKPVSWTRHSDYDYVLTSDLERQLPWELGCHDFCDEKGRTWLQFRGRLAIVRSGYSWDGASYAPDFADVVIASCLHDAFLQFAGVPCFPLSKSQIDRAFLDEMPRRFVFRRVYWGAVRLFGGAYARLSKKPRPPAICGLHCDRLCGRVRQ